MITDIRLQHFRSHSDVSFELNPGVNIIVGPNTSGKTNLLEAILMITRGSSYRARDSELVQFSEHWSKLEAHTTANETRIVKLENQENNTVKSFEINSQKYKRLSQAKSLPVIFFEPTHLQLLHGSPEQRRQFLDNLLEQTTTGYGSLLRQYKRTLAQRNSLLKSGPELATNQLFAWNIRLCELGAQIALARYQLIDEFNKDIGQFYSDIANTPATVKLDYQLTAPKAEYASGLLHKLERATTLDFQRGFTAHGPHREDFSVLLDGHLVQLSASRGETRTLLLVFKFVEAILLERARDQRPILLLDDVFSELDGARRQALTQFLQTYQSFITTTDADVVIQHFTQNTHIIPLKKNNGEI